MRRRLVLSYVALILLVLVVLEIPLGMSFADHRRDEVVSNLQRDAFVLASFSAETLAGREAVDLAQLADAYSERTGGRVVIVNASGAVRADSDPPTAGQRSLASRSDISAALNRQVVAGTRRSSALGSGFFYAAVPVVIGDQVQGAVQITYPADGVDGQVRRYAMTLVVVGLVALAAAAGVGVIFARWISRPIEDLTNASTRLGHGDLAVRSPTTVGPPEVRELANAFNLTAARLEELITAQEQFVADASHQLRTPLTALRLRLEMVEQAITKDGTEHDDVALDVAGAGREVQRLSRLVDGLLTLARADRMSATATAEIVGLDSFLDERRDAWALLAAEHGIEIACEPNHLSVRATPDRLTQAVDNLIANALEASPSGSKITLTSSISVNEPDGEDPSSRVAFNPRPTEERSTDSQGTRDGSQNVEIRVLDEGPGLTDEIRNHAFDRFRRVGPPDSKLGGSGLGLAIARKLIVADGGSIELLPRQGRGLAAVIRLPNARS